MPDYYYDYDNNKNNNINEINNNNDNKRKNSNPQPQHEPYRPPPYGNYRPPGLALRRRQPEQKQFPSAVTAAAATTGLWGSLSGTQLGKCGRERALICLETQ